MAEYIDKEAVIWELRNVYEREFPTADGAFDLFANRIVPRVIKNILAADVAPVVHGRWVDKMVRDWHCSECGKAVPKQVRFDGYCYADKLNYCPNCGARMDGGTDNG